MSDEKDYPEREELLANLLSLDHWVRILIMLLVGFISWLLLFVHIALAVIQALFVLFTGTGNSRLRQLGTVFSLYQAQIWLFMSYATESRPFPFNDFPADISDLETVAEAGNADQQPQRRPANVDEAEEAGYADTETDDDDDIFSDMSFTSSAAVSQADRKTSRRQADDQPEGDNDQDSLDEDVNRS